jgi:hypothetical protein
LGFFAPLLVLNFSYLSLSTLSDERYQLELHDIDVDPRWLEGAIRSSWLDGLENLIVTGVGHGDYYRQRARLWVAYEYLQLKNVTLRHLFKLKDTDG